METRELILATVRNLVTDFLYYDRKEDEDLQIGDIDEAVRRGIITKEEIIGHFESKLTEGLQP